MTTRMLVGVCLMAVCGLMLGCQTSEKAPEAAKVSAAPKPAPKPIAPLPDEKDKPFAVVLPVEAAPVLDGKISAGEWGEPALDSFYNEDTGKPVDAAVQTHVWLRYDAENLYIAAKLLEPEMEELVEEETEHDGEVWQDDCLEIFLDPQKKKDPADFYHLLINPLGVVCDRRGASDVSDDIGWTCKGLKVKTGKSKKYWLVEMAIPLASLGVTKPIAGQHWGANFCRERKPGNAENSSWVNMGPEWHQPEEFGHIAFQP